jgi:hypothetical protein
VKQPLFREVQRFTQPWLVVFIAFFAIFTTIGVWGKIFFGWPDWKTHLSDTALLIYWGIMPLLILLLFVIRLETEITHSAIRVRLWPVHMSFRVFPLDEIKGVFVRTYKPIREYGGWGWRVSLTGKGAAYNISGNHGIQLIFRNGRKLLIGTQKPLEAQQALKQLAVSNN